ncbi:uncharacterized protein LOC117645270 [Thrips palmi]|uniref:Uncharacterized protein LOC117645270 n=1 Tax=Thrips palmi TaxID=161013 RepID=A0A6P8YMQ0_THRPL|nr:uncharacterized protein LOC117645270 [Thrips palmi]
MTTLCSSSKVRALVLLMTFHHVRSRQINTLAGPYIAYGNRWDTCPSENVELPVRLGHFNPLRPYDPQTLSGEVTYKEDFGDNYITSVTVAKRSNNQWKENFFVAKFTRMGCSAVRDNIPNLFRIVVKYNPGMGSKKTCSIPAVRITRDTFQRPLGIRAAASP